MRTYDMAKNYKINKLDVYSMAYAYRTICQNVLECECDLSMQMEQTVVVKVFVHVVLPQDYIEEASQITLAFLQKVSLP